MRFLKKLFLFICVIITMLLPTLTTGCLEVEKKALKEHDFGAFLRATANDINSLNKALCNEQSIEKRKIIISIIRLKEPLWPEEGICAVLPNPGNYIEAPAIKGSVNENATA